jgi:hypothetical protein
MLCPRPQTEIGRSNSLDKTGRKACSATGSHLQADDCLYAHDSVTGYYEIAQTEPVLAIRFGKFFGDAVNGYRPHRPRTASGGPATSFRTCFEEIVKNSVLNYH